MDERDEEVNLFKLTEKYPKLKDIFNFKGDFYHLLTFKNIEKMSDDEIYKFLVNNIKQLKNFPKSKINEKILMRVLDEHPLVLAYINNSSEKLQRKAIEKDWRAAAFLSPNSSIEFIKEIEKIVLEKQKTYDNKHMVKRVMSLFYKKVGDKLKK